MESRYAKISDPSEIIPADDCGDIYFRIFNSMYDGICLFELGETKMRAIYLNERFFETVGYTREQYLPYYDNTTVPLFEEDEARVFDCARKCVQTGSDFYIEVRGYRHNGDVSWYCIRARQVDFVKSDKPVFVAAINDITEKKELEMELSINKERNRILEETSGAFLFEYDPIIDIMTFSPSPASEGIVINNYTRYMRTSGMIFESDLVIFSNTLFKASRNPCKGHLDVRALDPKKNEYVNCRIYYSSIADDFGYIIRVVGRLELINEEDGFVARFAADREINSIAGFSNCFVAEAEIKKRIKNSGKRLYMAVADIDDMSSYNEKFGREMGDMALLAMAGFLKDIYEDKAVLYRCTGDEFGIFIEDITDIEFHDLYEKLRSACKNAVINGKEGSGFTFSMGAAWTEDDDKAKNTDFSITADSALFVAKKDGKDQICVKKIIY